MSDQDSENPTSASQSKKKRKLLLMAGATAIVLVVAGGTALKLGGLKKLTDRHSGDMSKKTAAVPCIVEIPDIITNLDVGAQRARFIKLHARLLLPGADDRAAAERMMPQITDTVQTYLRAVTPDDLEGAEGTYRLRAALLGRIAIIVAPSQVTDVLFSQLLVQ